MLNRKLIEEWLEDFEGHQIYNADSMIVAGWPAEFIKPLVHTIKADPTSPTGASFFNGAKQTQSVDALDFARAVAYDIGADTSMPYFGRGRNGRHIAHNIKKRLEENDRTKNHETT